jgi:transposase-like protein
MGCRPTNAKRWVAGRKAAVVAAVSSGKITLAEACRRYQLSEEELFAWQRAFETHGVNGLRATYVQQYQGGRFSRPTRPASSAGRQFSTVLTPRRRKRRRVDLLLLPAGEDLSRRSRLGP